MRILWKLLHLTVKYLYSIDYFLYSNRFTAFKLNCSHLRTIGVCYPIKRLDRQITFGTQERAFEFIIYSTKKCSKHSFFVTKIKQKEETFKKNKEELTKIDYFRSIARCAYPRKGIQLNPFKATSPSDIPGETNSHFILPSAPESKPQSTPMCIIIHPCCSFTVGVWHFRDCWEDSLALSEDALPMLCSDSEFVAENWFFCGCRDLTIVKSRLNTDIPVNVFTLQRFPALV